MRPLVISPLFPPFADSESFCAGKFVQALIDAGGDPWVIYCSNVRTPLRSDNSLSWNSLEARSVDVPIPKTFSLGARWWFALRYQTTGWARWTAAIVSKARELHRRSP